MLQQGRVCAGWHVLHSCDGWGLQQILRHSWGWASSQGVLVAGSSSFPTCSCPACSLFFPGGWVRWTSWAGSKHWLNHSQSPWKVTVPLAQCWQPSEGWGPAQQRGGGIIPLFLLRLSPSSNFTGSCDLWPNPAREGTQLPWASPLGH